MKLWLVGSRARLVQAHASRMGLLRSGADDKGNCLSFASH
jgi:hypothetical protein